MSFSFDTKCEMCEIDIKKDCCKDAMLYGMILLAQHITEDSLKISTENVVAINVLNNLTYDIFGFNFDIGENINSYYAHLNGERLKEVYNRFYMMVNGRLDLSISGALTENSCCTYYFLRGAFLTAGYVSNPENSYHFEISTPFYNLAKALKAFMERLEFPVKTVVRKSNYIVYMKDSEYIERFLCFVGANSSAFSLMDAKIYKEMNNYSNRLNNTKIYNIEKTLNKSVEQVKAINLIAENKGLEFLESDLIEVANLRLNNPDKSLNELVALCNKKFSRSGLNRRLNKLMEISKKLGE